MMNWQSVERGWHRLASHLQEQWALLQHDKLAKLNARDERVRAVLQDTYGIPHDARPARWEAQNDPHYRQPRTESRRKFSGT